MTDLEKVLVETDLIKAISAFHDCDDKEKRERYVREYFLEFCSEYNIDENEALEMIEKFLRNKRENSQYKYEYFTDLKSIIYSDKNNRNFDDEER